MQQLEKQAMVDHYIIEMKTAEGRGEVYDQPNTLDEGAVLAFAHHVDGVATIEDLTVYRAWITRHRLEGISERDLKSSVAVADHMARMLGVA
jgi:hypothetical protein